ncbi:MAG: PAS domain S-box protein [Deltaproteobacteria bacterium]|nr:PAS domain S-box protein [Deltaproteobacteria bacterium]
MHPFESLKIAAKTKAILLVTSIITVLSLFYSLHQVATYNKQINSYLIEEKKDFQHIFTSTQNFYFSIYNNWLSNFIESNPENIKAFAGRDREKLYTLTRPMYDSLKKSYPHIHVMHFHLPDGDSFLRMHQPDWHGDDLRQIRSAVQEVHNKLKPLFGYEIGILGAFYRVIHPVFHEGQYVGAVEIGIRTDEIVNELRRTTDKETSAFFANTFWQKASGTTQNNKVFGSHTLIADNPLIAEILPADFKFDNSAEQIVYNGRTYLIHILEGFKNCFQEPIGGIIAVQDISREISEKRQFIFHSLLLTAGFGGACILLLSFSFKNLIGNLEDSQELQGLLIEELNREIEVRAETEKALTMNEIRHRHILNSLPDNIFLIDPRFVITWANETALQLTPGFIGTTCSFCRQADDFSHENCLCQKSFTSKSIQRATIHLPVTGKNGQERYFEFIAIPQFNEQEQLSGSLVVMRDITQRIKTDQQVEKLNRQNRLLLESAGEGIYGVDIQGRTTFMNPAAVRLTGFTEAEMLGRNQHELLHHTKTDGNRYPVCDCPVHATLATGKPHFVTNEVFWKKNGANFPVEYIVTPVLEGDEIIGAVVLFNDITARKTLEKQLLHAQKMEAVGRLTSGIAHDFNNLLTTILGYSEMLLMKLRQDDPIRDKIQMINQAGRMAAGLTRQLLTFSRKQILEIKTINLNTVIDRLTKMLERLIGENISLDIKYNSPECYIQADAGQCEQIIMNLVINAKDAMPKGGQLGIGSEVVHLDTEKHTGFDDILSGSYVLLKITDTGEGMTEETQKLIFEPFFTTKEQGKGTGLGLATVYGIIKQHNGFVTVSSAPGQGTTFDIYFPLSNAQPARETIMAGSFLPRGTETILVVDDTPSIRQFIRDALNPLGYKILEAHNGEEALKYHDAGASGTIDLLLTDMVMPGLSGKELARAMRPSHSAMRTLYMSGYINSDLDENQTGGASMNFITKPLSAREIAHKVRSVLDSHDA